MKWQTKMFIHYYYLFCGEAIAIPLTLSTIDKKRWKYMTQNRWSHRMHSVNYIILEMSFQISSVTNGWWWINRMDQLLLLFIINIIELYYFKIIIFDYINRWKRATMKKKNYLSYWFLNAFKIDLKHITRFTNLSQWFSIYRNETHKYLIMLNSHNKSVIICIMYTTQTIKYYNLFYVFTHWSFVLNRFRQNNSVVSSISKNWLAGRYRSESMVCSMRYATLNWSIQHFLFHFFVFFFCCCCNLSVRSQ